MPESEPRNRRVRAVLVTMAAVGCVGMVTLAGMGFFMFYTCAQGTPL